MKLVGASKGFIRYPFLIRSVSLGFISSLFAISILTALLFALRSEFSELVNLDQLELFGLLSIGVIASGIIISYLATFFAVTKYLRIKENELYY